MPDGTMSRASACCDDAAGLVPVATARHRLLAHAAPVEGTEAMAPQDALGRILAGVPTATMALPPCDQSAMDGYGLTEQDLLPGAEPRLLRLVAAGDPAGAGLRPGEAVRLLTGAALPEAVAAVVMEEHATVRDGRVRASRHVRPGDNIRHRGEDLACGTTLAEPGLRIDARHIALFAAAGVAQVAVRRRLRVAVLSNGNELGAGIHDSNRPMLRALLAGPGVVCTDMGILPDDPAALAAALSRAATAHDLILTSGGVSGSDADHLPRAIAIAGGRVEVLKLALKPGKPLAHGQIGAAHCLCLPGNPLAALVTMLAFGRPLLTRLAGANPLEEAPNPAVAVDGFSRRPGREEYIPACIVGRDRHGLPQVRRAGRAGSARLLPLSRADGLLWLPSATALVSPGAMVGFYPFALPFGL